MILGFIQNAVLNNAVAMVERLRGIICDRVSSLQTNFTKNISMKYCDDVSFIGQGQTYSE